MATTKDECFDQVIVLDFFQVMRYLQEQGYGDVHDPMFEMFPEWAQYGNDSYWHLYRHWIKTEEGKMLWDIIAMELGLTWEEPSYNQTLIDKGLRKPDDEPDWQKIVFWVSW